MTGLQQDHGGGTDNTDSFTVHVKVAPSVTGTLHNTASVAGGAADTNSAKDGSNTVDTTVTVHADLSIAKAGSTGAGTVSNPLVVAGDTGGFDYTLTVTNHGPADNHAGFAAHTLLPPGVHFHTTGSDSRCSAGSDGVH